METHSGYKTETDKGAPHHSWSAEVIRHHHFQHPIVHQGHHTQSPPDPMGAQPWGEDQTRPAADQLLPLWQDTGELGEIRSSHRDQTLSGVCVALLNPGFCVSDGWE